MAQSEERSLLTMKSRVRIPTVLNNTMQYALIPNYARRMELPLVAPPAQGAGLKKVVLIFFYMRNISMELLPEKSIQTSCRKISTGPFTNVPQFHTIIHQN